MSTTQSFKRLFASPEYQQMLKDHREEMKRVDAEGVRLFLSFLNPEQRKKS